jgi:hypothetical protein
VQSVFDALGEAAALTNSQSCPSVDALSEYLLGMKTLAEERYAEMLRLSSLPLDSYGTEEQELYTVVLAKAEKERANLERALRFELNRFSKEHDIILELDD